MIPSCRMIPKHVFHIVLKPQRLQSLKLSLSATASSAVQTYQGYRGTPAISQAEKTENELRLQASFEPDTDHRRAFPNVSVITTGELRKFLHDEFKLRFVKEREGNELTASWRPVDGVGTSAPKSGGVELLFNVAAKHDYWLIDKRRHHNMLYYRLELMRQRLEYLRSVGMDERQKLCDIRKCPPPLVFTMTNRTYHGKLVYLRGLVPKEEGEKHVHIYAPVARQIRDRKTLIDNRVESVCTQLNLGLPAVLHELMNMPCFFVDPATFEGEESEHMFCHLRSMPKYFNVDEHTLQLMPPMCDVKSLGITPSKHLRWNTAKKDLIAFPTWGLDQVLDVTYPTHNGRGTPECLSTFLLRADGEEFKARKEGGEVGKPRKGFNMKPRQY